MERKYAVQKNTNHIAVKYPKTLKAFGAFILNTSMTHVCYGIITHPSFAQETEQMITRDSAGGILLMFGAFAILSGLSTIKNFKLERKQKKLQAKLARREAISNSENDIYELYQRVEAQKRFDNIVEQTKGL